MIPVLTFQTLLNPSGVCLFRPVERCPPVCKHSQINTQQSRSAVRYYETTTDNMTCQWKLSEFN